jgi:hypothetical protein
MTTAQKNAKISGMIMARVQSGETLSAAIDAILGSGTFDRVTGEAWETLRKQEAAQQEPVAFKAGVSYFCRSACDSECIWHFQIIRRTASSVWVLVDGKESRRSVRVWDGVEKFEPFGRYSMSPVVSADRRSMTLSASA